MTAFNALRDALLSPDRDSGGARLLTGTVSTVNKTSTPWTCTVRLSDGTVTDSLAMLGWYDPRVDDVVVLAQQGPALLVLGSYAGVSKVVATTTTTVAAPTPAAPPPPPTPAPTDRTVNINAVSSKTYQPEYGIWRSGQHLFQGGGSAQRGLWFYGNAIATAKGSGTIMGGTIYVQRRNTTHGSGSLGNVRLGTHSYTAQPGGAPAAMSSVAQVGKLARGQALKFKLTAAQINALNAGAKGLGLEPGVIGYNAADYIIATGRDDNPASGQLSLVIRG